MLAERITLIYWAFAFSAADAPPAVHSLQFLPQPGATSGALGGVMVTRKAMKVAVIFAGRAIRMGLKKLCSVANRGTASVAVHFTINRLMHRPD